MKTKLTEGKVRGKPCLRFKAWITANKAHGINRRYQRTWSVGCVPPYVHKAKLKEMFQFEARRWHARIMAELFPSKLIPVCEQEEIEM